MRLWILALCTTLLSCASAKHEYPLITLETELGKIVIQVDDIKAPSAAQYFVSLVNRGDYSNAAFYRSGSLDGSPEPQLIQGGTLGHIAASRTPMTFEPGSIELLSKFETTHESGLTHQYASVSLARDLLKTGKVIPELVVCLRATPEMDAGARSEPDSNGFPVFGRVVTGMDIVHAVTEKKSSAPTFIPFLKGQILNHPVQILSAYQSNGKH